MKKFLLLLAALWIAAAGTVKAAEKEIYAVLSDYGRTLTIRYDTEREARDGRIPGKWGEVSGNVTTVTFNESVKEARPTSTGYWFSGFKKLEKIENLNYLNTENVTSMNDMFAACLALEKIDASGFSTKKVKSFDSMFYGCVKLKHLDIRNFDMGSATSANRMFESDRALETIVCDYDLSKNGNIADNEKLFADCPMLVGEAGTAYDASKITKEYARPDGVNGRHGYFTSTNELYAAIRGTSLFLYYNKNREGMLSLVDGCVTDWNTSELRNNIEKIVFTASMVNAHPRSTKRWFYNFKNVTEVEYLTNLNTSLVTDMSGMFYGCGKLKSLDLTNFNMGKVTNLAGMFNDCSSLTTIICDDDWSQYGNIPSSVLFAGCDALTGEIGTKYDGSGDLSFARPDKDNRPGYFTSSNEIYAALSSDGSTMTVYYDRARKTRNGMTDWQSDMTMTQKDKVTLVTFHNSMQNALPLTVDYWFAGFSNLKNISGIRSLNTSRVKNMTSMFSLCEKLESIDLRKFNTTNVELMDYMFNECRNLKSLDLSGFNTGNVEGMTCMFKDCSSLETLNLSNFNTGKVKYMTSMFSGCGKLTLLDLKSFNIHSLTSTAYMFSSCSSLEDIICTGDWSAAVQLVNSTDMFKGCDKIVGGKGTKHDSSKTDKEYARLDGGTSNPGYFSSQSVKEFYAALGGDGTTLTFYYDKSKTARGGVTEWNTAELRGKVTKIVIAPSVRDYRPVKTAHWFREYTKLKSIEGLDNLVTPLVTDMSYMFYECSSLEAIDLSNFDTRNATDMNSMFRNCGALKSLDLSNFKTQKVTDMEMMFFNCKKIETLDLSSFNTQKVIIMSNMFAYCSSLTKVDIHSFDISSLTKANSMFINCSKLTTILCDGDWSASDKLAVSDYMFSECTKLVGDEGTVYDADKRDKEYARVDGVSGKGYFTSSKPVEIYAVRESDGTTLTIYYDKKRDIRGGKTPAEWSALKENITKVIFDETVKEARPTSTASWFFCFRQLQEIVNLSYLNTEKTSDMNDMFNYCSSLEKIEFPENFKTGNVTTMNDMFCNCTSLTTLDVSGFNMAKVRYMSAMFANCPVSVLDLRNFKLSASDAENTYAMFYGCSSLETIICDDDWTKNTFIANSNAMFYGCERLKGGNGTEFDAAKINIEYARTDGAGGNKGYFSLPPKEMYAVLESDGTTMTLYYDTECKAKGGVKDWYYLPYNSASQALRGNVTKAVFDESFKDAKPTSTYNWFGDFQKLESIEHLDYLNTEEVDNMAWMFGECRKIKSLDVSHFNTSNVMTMGSMFYNCKALTSLDVSGFNTENVLRMCYLFSCCTSLTSLDVSGFNTENVTNMRDMFSVCKALTSLDVSGFNTENVTDMCYMFERCQSLEKIICDGDWSKNGNVTNSYCMFSGCEKLVGGNGTKYDANHLDVTYAVTDGLDGKKGYFTSAVTVYHTVTFYDNEGNVIGTPEQVEEGKAATAPEAPAVEGYKFVKWDTDFSNVTTNLDIKPLYEILTFTVTFYDHEDNVIGTPETVEYGSAATEPSEPVWAGHEFKSWDKAFDNVKSDLDIHPLYDVQVLDVKFIGYGDAEIITLHVEYGKAATAPDAPEVDGWKFKGWDKTFDNVTENMEVKAVYEQLAFDIRVKVVSTVAEDHTTTEEFAKLGCIGYGGFYSGEADYFDIDGTDLSGKVSYGSIIMFSFQNKLYTFDHWSDNSVNNDYQLIVTQAHDLTLYLKPVQLSVAAVSEEEKGTVTVSGSEFYYYQREDWNATLTAQAKKGWAFDAWIPELDWNALDVKPEDLVTANRTMLSMGEASGLTPAELKILESLFNPTLELHGKDLKAINGFVEFDNSGVLNFRAVYKEKPVVTYTVNFVYYDGTLLKSEQVDEGEFVVAPSNPVREGYTFTGWLANGGESVVQAADINAAPVNKDITYTAQFEKDTTTAIDEMDMQTPETRTRKFIENGILYIERNGIRYTLRGQRLN